MSIFSNPLEDSRPGLAWLEPQNAPKTDPWLAPLRPPGGPKASLLAGPRLASWLAPWLAVHVLELAVQHVNSRMIRLPEPPWGSLARVGFRIVREFTRVGLPRMNSRMIRIWGLEFTRFGASRPARKFTHDPAF